MIKLLKNVLLLFALSFIGTPFLSMTNKTVQNQILSEQPSADTILKIVSEKLNLIKNLTYDYAYETRYYTDNDSFMTKARVFLNFEAGDTLIGFKYQIDNPNTKFIYNGIEEFSIDKKGKSIEVNSNPKRGNFNSIIYFSNSITTLRNILPVIILDESISKSINDTTIDNKSYYLITFTPHKKVIDPLGKSFSNMTIERSLTYKIVINKTNYLPVQVLQTFSDNINFQRTMFSNVKLNGKVPSKESWYFSSYTPTYTIAKPKDIPKLISVNTAAPNWTLPVFNEKNNISLSQFTGSYLLIEFWIKNCGYCMAAFPKLKALQEKYKDKKFEIVAINSYDTKQQVNFINEKFKPNFKLLYNSMTVVKEYGVYSYPTIILVDPNGQVIYAGNFDETKIHYFLDKAF